MQQFSDLTRSWSDALTALSVGSLAFLLLVVGQIDPDGSLSFHLRRPLSVNDIVGDLNSIGSLLIAIVVLSLIMATGYFLIQFGEFISILAELGDRGVRSRKRAKACAENPAFLMMFSNAYTSYRLLCGIGAVLLVSALWLFLRAVMLWSLQPAAPALLCLFSGMGILLRFARYSYASLDWTLFGDLRE